jgi:hypothetical protein
MSGKDRRSALLAEYLDVFAEDRESEESGPVRSFLASWAKVTRGGNALCLELRVERAKLNMAVVFVYSKACGPVRWLPALVVPWSDKLDRIRRECGDDERNPVRPEPVRDVWGQVERKRPPVLPKVEVRLVRS